MGEGGDGVVCCMGLGRGRRRGGEEEWIVSLCGDHN